MKSLEISARTVEEATQRALDQLGVSREAAEVTVVKEGKTGILGMGAEDAVVRVTTLTPEAEDKGDVAAVAKDVLEKLLALMGVDGTVAPQAQLVINGEEEAGASIAFDVQGDDLGILIGRRRQTLAGLQYIVRLITGNRTKTWIPIVVDVGGYKERRYQALQVLVRRMAEQVQTRKAPFTLEPMPADERRIIHVTLAGNPAVTTESTGEGEARRVVILPAE